MQTCSHFIRPRPSGNAVHALAIAIAASCVLGACASHDAVIAKLEVLHPCSYTVDGKPVAASALAEALRSAREGSESLSVHFVLSPGVQYECVRAAVAAAQQAGVSVGMVGNVRP